MGRFVFAAARRLGCVVATALWAVATVLAAEVSEDAVKAGFILNFAKFTDWPASAGGGDRLLICSLGSGALSGALESLQGRIVKGRAVRVRGATRPSELHECQILFIAADEEERIEWILQRVASLPVLTVSDAPHFVNAGGMIGLFQENDRLRFDINLAMARQNNLTLSSNLLRLARVVKQ